MVQITERIQVIRLCCFRYAVDDRAGFRTIDTVDQFPRMFMQAEAAERSFCYVVVKWCNQRAQTDGFAEQNGRDAERADLTYIY